MREILFRGKRHNGKWVFGALSKCDEPYFIRDRKKLENEILVHPITIGQYTGLKDKNGTKIFEGDIVKYKSSISDEVFTSVVMYGEFMADNSANEYSPIPCYGWYVSKGLFGDISLLNKHSRCEVIGNIHDDCLEDLQNGG